MASKAQISANQANAQRSTGPNTPDGRSISRRNAVKHGLASRATNLFLNDPGEQANFTAHKEILRKQLMPEGALEEKIFHLYVFSLFQAERSQILELACHDAWLDDQSNPILISNMDRMARYGEVHERRAARSLNELRKLQLDRFSSGDVRDQIAVQGERTEISRALPVSTIRKGDFQRTNPLFIAATLIGSDPEIQSRPKKADKPAPHPIDWLAHSNTRLVVE